MAKARKWWVDYAVYLAVRSIVCVIQAVPQNVALTFAWVLARAAYTFDKRHRKVADENLRHAFGDQLTDEQRSARVLAVYHHFARVIVEIALIPRKLHINNWKKYVTFHGVEPALQGFLGQRPVILVTGHFGNWEMAGYLIAALGVEGHAIARTLDNPYLNAFLLRFRQGTGQTILNKNGDFDKIERVLANNGVLVSVADQSAGPKGYFVPFFGRLASTHKAIAILAMKFNALIILGYAYRDQPGFHYKVGCSRILDPADYAGRSNAAMEITRELSTILESVIREAPDQYLWLHNRWKHQPPARALERLAA